VSCHGIQSEGAEPEFTICSEDKYYFNSIIFKRSHIFSSALFGGKHPEILAKVGSNIIRIWKIYATIKMQAFAKCSVLGRLQILGY